MFGAQPEPYRRLDFQEIISVYTGELTAEAPTVAYQLVGRLMRSLGTADWYHPHLVDPRG